MFQKISFHSSIILSIVNLFQEENSHLKESKTKGLPSDLKEALPDLLQEYQSASVSKGMISSASILPDYEAILKSKQLITAEKQLQLRTNFTRDFFSTRLKGAALWIRRKRGLICEKEYPSFKEVKVHVVFPGAISVCLPVEAESQSILNGEGIHLVYPGFLTDAECEFPVCVSLLFRLTEIFYKQTKMECVAVASQDEIVGNLRTQALKDALAAAVEVQWLNEDNANVDAWMNHLGIR